MRPSELESRLWVGGALGLVNPWREPTIGPQQKSHRSGVGRPEHG